MGPRVQVDPAEFLRILENEKGLVIKGRPIILRGTEYVTRSGDYYYFTFAKEPLTLPKECKVTNARQILL